jgi:hypothetical protein
MARRARMTVVGGTAAQPEAPAVGGADPAEFQRLIAEINRQKKNSSEYQGMAGKLTRDAIDQHSLDRVAFGFVMRLSRMDEAQKQAAIRSFIDYAERAGFLDQMDTFSDLTDLMAGVVDRLKARIPNRPRDASAVDQAVDEAISR